jgi:hypothetical protein
VQLPGELAGAAAEIDDPPARTGLHEGREIPERSRSFGLEAFVLIRIPLLRVRCRQPVTLPSWKHAALGILPDSGRAAERLERETMIADYSTTVRLIPRRVRAW